MRWSPGRWCKDMANRPSFDDVAATVNYVALTGPTASGKTAAAFAIARQWDVEIISVDSALVYTGMDIGTAKPTPHELAQVPHHLINIRDPLHAYSAADFARDAARLIAEINARGKLALLVGGTMLYFKALWDGLDNLPQAHPEMRATIEAEALANGWPALHAELAKADLITAQRLAPNDSQRISRALEVYRISGQPLSSFFTQKLATSKPADFTLPKILISLEPTDRAWLHERITQRFDAMLAAGLVGEVKTLRARGDLHADLPSMRCVGYRQTWMALEGALPMNELRERGIIATRQLAKRQMTWLRSFSNRTVVACDQADAMEQVVALVETAVTPNT